MNVTVRTESPFRGVVYAEGHRTDCYAMGYGLRETSLSVPFAAIDRCGIQYDSVIDALYTITRPTCADVVVRNTIPLTFDIVIIAALQSELTVATNLVFYLPLNKKNAASNMPTSFLRME